MTYFTRDDEGKLVPVREGIPAEAIRAIERYDEEAIVHRLTTGMGADAFIYHYPIKTKTGTKQIIGVSTDGSYELASMLGNIEVLSDVKVDKDSDPDYFYAMVRARDITRNVTLLGTGRQCKFMVDAGNNPIRDRLNEHAFVSSISKAQRNAILHLAPEEVIIKIVETWATRGKSRQIKPPVLEVEEVSPKVAATTIPAVPTTALTQEEIAEQQERLKNLRMEVHNRFQTDLGIGVEARKKMLDERFGVGSLTDLSEQQLKECKVWVEEMIDQRTIKPPPKIVGEVEDKIKELGFEDANEQGRLRGRLYSVLTAPNQLNLKDEEAKKFITDRGFTSTIEISKNSLVGLIQEVNELVKAKETPSSF